MRDRIEKNILNVLFFEKNIAESRPSETSVAQLVIGVRWSGHQQSQSARVSTTSTAAVVGQQQAIEGVNNERVAEQLSQTQRKRDTHPTCELVVHLQFTTGGQQQQQCIDVCSGRNQLSSQQQQQQQTAGECARGQLQESKSGQRRQVSVASVYDCRRADARFQDFANFNNSATNDAHNRITSFFFIFKQQDPTATTNADQRVHHEQQTRPQATTSATATAGHQGAGLLLSERQTR